MLFPLRPALQFGRIAALVLTAVAIAGLATLQASSQAWAQAGSERRIALVIGNAAYPAGALATPANDAGLIAQTLQAAGFDVIGARDLEGESLRSAFRDFLEKATESGPSTVAFVYLAGHGVQFEGDNYFVPVDAKIERDTDVPLHAIRLSDYLRPLSALPLKARFIVLDAARENPYSAYGNPLAGGLALVEPETGSMLAYNAAPGTIAPEGAGPYGAYAQSLAEMIRDGGLAADLVFDRARLRVSDVTQGAYIPWHAGRIEPAFYFFERAADAPTPVVATEFVERRTKAIRSFEPDEAFLAAIDRDTLAGYIEFMEAYPDHRLAKRARAIAAARREAITWRRTCSADTADAYWSYLDRYPKGPHAWDARRRLRRLAVEAEPPPTFVRLVYDVPPPPVEEFYFVERRVIYYSDPYFAFAAPPRYPIYYLPPPPRDFIVLAPPPPIFIAYALPFPAYIPVAKWVKPHPYVVAPPNNLIYKNIHGPVVQTLAPAGPGGPGAPHAGNAGHGPSLGTIAAGAAAVGLAAAALKVALPPGVAKKAATLPPGVPGAPKGSIPLKTAAPTALPIPGKGTLPHAPGLTLPKGQPATPGGPATLPKTTVVAPVGQPVIKPGSVLPQKTVTTAPPVDAAKSAERLREVERKNEQLKLEQQRRELARKSAEKARERAALAKKVNEDKPRKVHVETNRVRPAVTVQNKVRQQANHAAVERHRTVVTQKSRPTPAKTNARRCGGPGLPRC